MTRHTKKVYKKYFDQIAKGEKTYEVRLADWECKQGDELELIEVDDETRNFTGRTMVKKVGAVIRTKEIESLKWWADKDIKEHGFQVIALIDGDKK